MRDLLGKTKNFFKEAYGFNPDIHKDDELPKQLKREAVRCHCNHESYSFFTCANNHRICSLCFQKEVACPICLKRN